MNEDFMTAFKGSFSSLLRWEQLDQFWETIRKQTSGQWYIYAVGEAPPTTPSENEKVFAFLTEIDALLRREHDEDYCGIVYADNPAQPTFIKIYDPNNLGSSCGSGFGPPPLPGWILSTLPPVDLKALQPTNSRRRWWGKLFGS